MVVLGSFRSASRSHATVSAGDSPACIEAANSSGTIRRNIAALVVSQVAWMPALTQVAGKTPGDIVDPNDDFNLRFRRKVPSRRTCATPARHAREQRRADNNATVVPRCQQRNSQRISQDIAVVYSLRIERERSSARQSELGPREPGVRHAHTGRLRSGRLADLARDGY